MSAYNILPCHAILTRIGLHRTNVYAAFQGVRTEGVAMGPLFTPDYQMWDAPVDRLRRDVGIMQPRDRADTSDMSARLLQLAPPS